MEKLRSQCYFVFALYSQELLNTFRYGSQCAELDLVVKLVAKNDWESICEVAAH